MGATFSRLKTWTKERLKFSDLNAEFNNILNNLTPAGIDDKSVNLADMRSTVDPAPYVSGVQTESLATSLEGEIQRIRYVLAKRFGGSYWYSDSGRVDNVTADSMERYMPCDGVNANEAYIDCISHGGIINALQLSAQDFDSTGIDTTNTKFGKPSIALGTKLLGVPGYRSEVGALSFHFRNSGASKYLATNPVLGMELILDASGYLKLVQTKSTATASESAKDSVSITGAASVAGSTSFKHVLARFKLNNALGAGTDAIELFLDGISVGAPILSSNVLKNIGHGGNWYLGAKQNNPAWNKFSAMKVKPKDETADAFTHSDDSVVSLASGVLNIATVGSDSKVYKTNNIDMSNMTIETKFRVTSGTATVMAVKDLSMNKAFTCVASKNRIAFFNAFYQADVASQASCFELSGEFSEYNVLRVTFSGSPDPTVKIYLNGNLVYSYTMLDSTVTALVADEIAYGRLYTETGFGGDIVHDIEHFAYHGASATAPIAIDSQGQIADFVTLKDYTADNVKIQLVNNKAKIVFGEDGSNKKLSLPNSPVISGSTGISYAEIYFPTDGKKQINLDSAIVSLAVIAKFISIDSATIQSGNTSTVIYGQNSKMSAGLHNAVCTCIGVASGHIKVSEG